MAHIDRLCQTRPWATPSSWRRVWWVRLCLTGWLAMAIAVDGSSADDGPTQDLAFFAAEAATFAGHTAARMPYLAADAPATVHIISRQDLEAFGAFHLWDALRGTPGMDVVAAGGGHGLVGIRGLTKVGNNRILILLDGRRISDTDSESLTWGSLPIPTREIERIEVVEGPASALYGGNALTGVINIISRSPNRPHAPSSQQVSAMLGDHRTNRAGWSGSGQLDGHGWRLGLEGERLGRFDATEDAARAFKVHASLRGGLSRGTSYRLHTGVSRQEGDVSLGFLGPATELGSRAFLRTDIDHGPWHSDVHLYGGRKELTSAPDAGETRFSSGQITLQRRWQLEPGDLVLGGEVRRDAVDNLLVDVGQTLYALYGEQRVDLHHRVDLWASARLDHHPLAGTQFSPRLSLVGRPIDHHTIRFSAGAAFRHPTLLENHLQLAGAFDVSGIETSGLIDTVEFSTMGNPALDPERMRFVEFAHQFLMRGITTQMTAYHYHLSKVFAIGMVRNTLPRPGVVRTEFSIVNGSQTRAQGAEIGWRASWGRRWEGRGSYSYQRLSSNPDGQVTRNGTPQHKGSLFLRFRDRGIAFDGGVHRVGRTKWNSNRLTTDVPRTLSVDPYTLVQMSVAYEFVGRWRGLRISVLAFNLLGQDHEELLVSPQPLVLAQSGRSIGSRRALRISYAW